MDELGDGNSSATPLPLEVSTAVGDSGGPAFVLTSNQWRIHGVVSYGTNHPCMEILQSSPAWQVTLIG